jgi:hypothetical protein
MADVTALLAGLRQETPPAVAFDPDANKKPVGPADASGTEAGAETETRPT